MKKFIRCLAIRAIFKPEHVTIPVPIRGRLPEDKEEMLALPDRLIEMAKEGCLDHFREKIIGL